MVFDGVRTGTGDGGSGTLPPQAAVSQPALSEVEDSLMRANFVISDTSRMSNQTQPREGVRQHKNRSNLSLPALACRETATGANVF